MIWTDYINNEDSIKARLERDPETWIIFELLESRIRDILRKGEKN